MPLKIEVRTQATAVIADPQPHPDTVVRRGADLDVTGPRLRGEPMPHRVLHQRLEEKRRHLDALARGVDAVVHLESVTEPRALNIDIAAKAVRQFDRASIASDRSARRASTAPRGCHASGSARQSSSTC